MLVGMLLSLEDGRPAHLTRVHACLIGLPEKEQRRLGVLVQWRSGSHLLTYRQVERTFGLVCDALSKAVPDGTPSLELCQVVDDLLEASVPERYKNQSSSVAVDWTDIETFAKRPVKDGKSKDKEASWGHRAGEGPAGSDEIFFGYYLQGATTVRQERGPAVPELARRMLLTTCRKDPVPAFVPVLERMHNSGIAVGDVLADSAYGYRSPENWAAPLRAIGAKLVQDMHPGDRGRKGTYKGAIISNGNLYCPATPVPLLELGPVSRDCSKDQLSEHDNKTALLSAYKLGRITAYDQDGYHRVMCPAAMGKIRCPHRRDSMTLSLAKPEVLQAPEPAPTCCTQKTVTVPVQVCLKTAQKHDYPSKAHRQSYKRRTGAERTFASIKDPARNDISKGWCRVMGVAPMTLFLACLFVTRNLRTTDTFERRRANALSKASKEYTRPKRRKTLADMAAASAGPPP
ncbi:MAG: hypothetical protein ACRDIA_02595 [Actinomycetota bacterium]